MHSFDAHYDETGAARAERAFFARSAKELRPWSTFGIPALLAVLATVAVSMSAPVSLVLSCGVMLLASILMPVFSYFARSHQAAKLAQETPVRRITLSTEALMIDMNQQRIAIEWTRVLHVWRAHGYTLLVIDRLTAVSIPDASIPDAARAFIETAVKTSLGTRSQPETARTEERH